MILNGPNIKDQGRRESQACLTIGQSIVYNIRDMKSLPATVRDEFEKDGHWVLSKTVNTFSAIPFDQANEQENKIVKRFRWCCWAHRKSRCFSTMDALRARDGQTTEAVRIRIPYRL